MKNNEQQILIYGANGYTGKLILEQALARGLKPVIAGRNQAALDSLALKDQLTVRVFSLDSIEVITQQLADIELVIHCAGPFSATAKPMMRACLLSHTHYTDITGEISVFELAQSMHEAAKASGVVLCPGVGFDVVPTDCLASQLKQKMPDATHLTLGFDSASSMSPGTAKTSLEGLAQGGKVRSNGQIISVPLVFKTRVIDFGNGEKHAMTIPWGDVSTAYYSTGIPNIKVYIPVSPKSAKKIRRLNWLKWLLALSPIQNYLKNKITRSTKGPDEQQRYNSKTFIWGEVSNAQGETISARYQTFNGYHFTYLAAIEIANHLLNNSIAGGTYTPSQLIDNQIAQRLAGSTATIFD